MARTESPAFNNLVVIRRTVVATVQRAFEAWTDPASIALWGAPGASVITRAEVDLRVGGRFVQHMRAANGFERRVSGSYITIDAPHKLVYTWRWEIPPEENESQVTVEFLAVGDNTEIIVTHALLTDDLSRQNHGNGWSGCLDKYVALLQQADTLSNP